MAENPKILSKMAAEGLQNTIKVKLTSKQVFLDPKNEAQLHLSNMS